MSNSESDAIISDGSGLVGLNHTTAYIQPAPDYIKRRGRPESSCLEPHKALIVQLFASKKNSLVDIAHRLNVDYGLNVSERTISRRLSVWKVPRRKQTLVVTQELKDRIIYHYNKNLNDEDITSQIHAEGFEIKPRVLTRLRQTMGLRRRSRYPEFREFSDGGEDTPDAQLAAEADSVAHTPKPKPKPKSVPKKGKRKAKVIHNSSLIPQVTAFVEQYMSAYDGSHDFNHIRRVVGLASAIYSEIVQDAASRGEEEDLDLHVITLSALLHDVGDKKYLKPGQDANTLVLATLLKLGAAEDLAIKVQRIVLGVSYSSEVKDPSQVKALIERYPELAIIQDADRLDAIGAIGIGRTFTFGGAKGAKNMGETIQHFEDKLEKLGGMMKTAPGRKMAQERTERLKIFKSWWEEEQQEAEGILRRK